MADWQPIETAPFEELHIRGMWVTHILSENREEKRWHVALGIVGDNGDFVTDEGSDLGWSADDYSHWIPVQIPHAPEHK